MRHHSCPPNTKYPLSLLAVASSNGQVLVAFTAVSYPCIGSRCDSIGIPTTRSLMLPQILSSPPRGAYQADSESWLSLYLGSTIQEALASSFRSKSSSCSVSIYPTHSLSCRKLSPRPSSPQRWSTWKLLNTLTAMPVGAESVGPTTTVRRLKGLL